MMSARTRREGKDVARILRGISVVIVLFVGDVVGAAATAYVAERVPELRREHGVDLVIVNAENCAPTGLGMTVELVELLFRSGVDVITGGNHSWDGDEVDEVLAHPRVLRPHNLAAGVPGTGLLSLDVAGETVTVLNLSDSGALAHTRAVAGKVLPSYACWAAAERKGTVIVDFHGEHVIEKQIFACAVDGEAAAVVGTHTHEPTLPVYVLPRGTGFVTDVGMTGPLGGVQGFAPRKFVEGLKQAGDHFALGIPAPAIGPIWLGAVLLEVEDGRTTRIERLTETSEDGRPGAVRAQQQV
jgi:2',3'-cyclic-nucleotide 2'-phosphodiesterase